MNYPSSLFFLRKFLLLSILSTVFAPISGRAASANTNTQLWSANWGGTANAGTVYTIGSGTVTASGQQLTINQYFATSPHSGFIDLDNTYNIQYLLFNGTDYSGTTGESVESTGGSLVLTPSFLSFGGWTGGGIDVAYNVNAPNIKYNINTPIYLEGSTGTTAAATNGMVFFTNNTIASENITLNFGTAASRSNIQGLQLSSTTNPTAPVILTLYGTGNGTINDNIIDGAGQGTGLGTAVVSLDFVSAATWSLTGTNTYSGPTFVTGGGTLLLDDTTVNSQKISNGALTLGGNFSIATGGNLIQQIGAGSTIELLGNASAASTQMVSSTTIGQGANTITVVSGSGQSATFNLNSLNRTAAGTVNFVTNSVGGGAATINTTGLASTTTSDSTGSILDGWATLNGTDWAALDSNGNVIAATYVTFFGAGNDVQITHSETADDNSSNSLQFTSATAPVTLTMGNGANTIASGGIMVSSAEGAQSVTITNGTLFSSYVSTTGGPSTSDEFYVQQFDLNAPLYIKSILGSPILTLAGGGLLNISGNNVALTTVNIDSGTLQLGSSTALASKPNVNLFGNTSALDLNGFNASITNLSSTNFMNGQVSQAAGLVPLVENTAAGTISTLTIGGGAPGVFYTSYFTGNLAEGAGAVLDITKTGSGAIVISGGFYSDGSFNSIGQGSEGGTLAGGTYEMINGGLTISGGTVNIDEDLYMLGALNLNGGVLQSMNNNTGGYSVISTSYLEGTTNINLTQNRTAVYVNLGLGGTASDSYSGQVINGNLVINGAGIFNLTAAQTTFVNTNSGFDDLVAAGTVLVVTPGITAPIGDADGAYNVIGVLGAATVKITGNSGTVAGTGKSGSGIGLAGGTLWIAPATLTTTPKNVQVFGATAAGATLFYGTAEPNGGMTGNGILLLDRGGNDSLAFTIGNTANTAAQLDVTRSGRGTLVIAATDGLSGLGSTEKFTLLGASIPSTANGTLVNNMVNASIVGAADTSGALGQATFLTYTGNGAVGDTGFTGVTYTDTNFAAATATSLEQVTSPTSISGAHAAYALRVDNALTNTGTLTLGNASTTIPAGLILNNASILGAGTLASGASELSVYVEGAGTIANAITTTGGLTVFGPGTLYLTQTPTYSGITTLNSGVLDIASPVATNIIPTASNLQLEGGILESSGTFGRALGTSTGQVVLANGGFAASSAAGFNILIGNSLATSLIWTNTANFLGDDSILQLGSATALGITNFQNNLVLGPTLNGLLTTTNGYEGYNNATLYREFGVTDNTSTFADYGRISGVISTQTGDYRGIEKVGNGMLYLSAANTYVGPTAISAGTLAINSDSSLGSAPTAAYAITGTVTLGAVQIDGGATLLDFANNVELSANRTMLLGGGGVSGLAVETGNTLTVDSRIGDAINTTAAGGGSGGGSLDINPTTGNGYDASTTHGAVVFTGNFNTYSGGTTVETGTTFFANNTLSTSSATGTGAVNIKSGAVLRGTGYIAPTTGGVTIASAADLAPGTASASTVAQGFLTLNSAGLGGTPVLSLTTPASSSVPAQLSFSLGTGINGVTGSGLVINGLTLAGSSNYISLPTDAAGEVVFSLNAATPTLIQLNDLTNGTLAAGKYLLFAGTANTDYANIGQTNGVITGDLALAPGFTGGTATLFLQNGDIYVNVTQATPEPSTYALLLLSFILIPIYRWRRARIVQNA